MTIEIRFDIPRNEWWTQNRRGHWRAGWSRAAAVKQRARMQAMAFKRARPESMPARFPVHVTAIIHPLTYGRFDPENAAPMVKAILDALTEAGWWPDDDGKHLIGPDYRAGERSEHKGWYGVTVRVEEVGV